MKSAARVFCALQRTEQVALLQCARSVEWVSRVATSFPQHARGFCHVPLPPNPTPSSSTAFGIPPGVSDTLDEAACFGSTFRKKPAEWSVNVKSFLLGSQLDLVQLKPQFRDVLRAEGKVSSMSCCGRAHDGSAVNCAPVAHCMALV